MGLLPSSFTWFLEASWVPPQGCLTPWKLAFIEVSDSRGTDNREPKVDVTVLLLHNLENDIPSLLL